VTSGGAVHAGIDGGGTRTRVVLLDAAGEVLHRAEGGPGLIGREGPEAAGKAVADMVRRVAAEAGCALPLATLRAGLAGAGEREARERVTGVLRRAELASRVEVVSDGEIALAAAFGEGAGILIIAGTGSVAFGRGPDGRTGRCGGWGAVLGDEGGGHALGIGALRTVLRVADEVEPATELVPAVLEATGRRDPRALPAWAGAASKADVAALAPLVLRLAAEGDPAAGRLVEAATEHLAECVVSLGHRLGPWPGPTPLAWTGGLTRDPFFAGRLAERIGRDLPGTRISREPLDPGLAAARAAAGIAPASVPESPAESR
jgi:glucosamine kinase